MKIKLTLNKMIVILIVGCCIMWGTYFMVAKYIHESKVTNTVSTDQVYFSSDILDGATHEITTNGQSETDFSFELMNYDINNELLISNVDLNYEVTIHDDTENTDVNTISNLIGTITQGSATTSSINLTGLVQGHTYTVTAKLTGSYEKTLTGTIKVMGLDENVYATLIDKTQYIEVDVYTKDYNGDIKIDYSSCTDLIPDNTNEWMNDAKSNSTITSSFEKNTSHVYRFFKKDKSTSYAVDINNNDKVVTINETTSNDETSE